MYLPEEQKFRLQLKDVSLQGWHMVGLSFQLLDLLHAAEQHLPGLLHLSPHGHLLTFQGLVAVLKCSHGLFGAPQFLLQSLVAQHDFIHLLIPGAPQQLDLVDNVLQVFQVTLAAFQQAAAAAAARVVRRDLFLMRHKAAVFQFVLGMAFPQSHLKRRATGKQEDAPSAQFSITFMLHNEHLAF